MCYCLFPLNLSLPPLFLDTSNKPHWSLCHLQSIVLLYFPLSLSPFLFFFLSLACIHLFIHLLSLFHVSLVPYTSFPTLSSAFLPLPPFSTYNARPKSQNKRKNFDKVDFLKERRENYRRLNRKKKKKNKNRNKNKNKINKIDQEHIDQKSKSKPKSNQIK